mgnify:CR=1 FL=1
MKNILALVLTAALALCATLALANEVKTPHFSITLPDDWTQPNEIISIRYDSRENLIASGVIREPIARPYVPPVPRAFPQSDNLSYVPDPR